MGRHAWRHCCVADLLVRHSLRLDAGQRRSSHRFGPRSCSHRHIGRCCQRQSRAVCSVAQRSTRDLVDSDDWSSSRCPSSRSGRHAHRTHLQHGAGAWSMDILSGTRVGLCRRQCGRIPSIVGQLGWHQGSNRSVGDSGLHLGLPIRLDCFIVCSGPLPIV